MKMDDKSRGIQSIEHGFVILKNISEANKALTITEISEICEMPKSKLHRYLISLRRIGFLERDKNLRYSLGAELILFGLKASRNFDASTEIEKCMDDLNQQLNETLTLAIWGENGPFYYKMRESQKPLNIGVVVGTTVPMTKGATGKIFAAFMPEQKTKELLEKEFMDNHLDKTAFQNEIAQIIQKGYVTTIGGLYPGVSAIAVPVFQQQELIAVMTLIGLDNLIDVSETSPLISKMKKTASDLSIKLGLGS